MVTQEKAVEVYNYLKQAGPCDVAATVVPTATVRNYVGELDGNNLFHGHGVLVSAMGYTYEGSFVHGSIEGHGRIVWHGGVSYEGEFNDNAPHGSGVLIKANSDKYIGEVHRGVYHGRGECTTATGVYNGQWCYGKRQGYGRQTYTEGNSFYEGEWLNNMRHGKGILHYPNGDLYDGMWKNGKRHGFGSMGWKAGTSCYVELYEGQWYEGVPHGRGRSTYIQHTDPSRVPSDMESPALFAYSNSAVVNIYEGEFNQGKRHGFGIFYYADGSTYEGMWSDGGKEGWGKVTTNAGISYYGTFNTNKANNLPEESTLDPLPKVALLDLISVAEESTEEAISSIRFLILRFNNHLKDIFTEYCGRQRDIKLITTHPEWWRRRVPGHMCVPQFLRLLSDAQIINGYVSMGSAADCIVRTLEEEIRKDSAGTGERYTSRMEKLRSDVLRLDGHINYRQFVESLLRLGTIAYTGPNFVQMSQQFTVIVRNLIDKRCFSNGPVCPITREYEAILTPDIVARLESLYLTLADDALPELRGTSAVLTAHNFFSFFSNMLESCNIELWEAVNHVLPFDRFNVPGVVPSAVCQPRSVMGYSLYEKSAGPRGEFLAALVTSQRCLTFVEFIEAVLAVMRLTGTVDMEDVRKGLLELVRADG
uniref:Uncharacterized protein TCIL3000_11_7750 n=1 Tax=Trypanosoma congolense (strain IL3000) TaxID=1068625 RepID=G0V115_TRYCI|nr:unnamed protein product [Trypanosoma congolense IL3000]